MSPCSPPASGILDCPPHLAGASEGLPVAKHCGPSEHVQLALVGTPVERCGVPESQLGLGPAAC